MSKASREERRRLFRNCRWLSGRYSELTGRVDVMEARLNVLAPRGLPIKAPKTAAGPAVFEHPRATHDRVCSLEKERDELREQAKLAHADVGKLVKDRMWAAHEVSEILGKLEPPDTMAGDAIRWLRPLAEHLNGPVEVAVAEPERDRSGSGPMAIADVFAGPPRAADAKDGAVVRPDFHAGCTRALVYRSELVLALSSSLTMHLGELLRIRKALEEALEPDRNVPLAVQAILHSIPTSASKRRFHACGKFGCPAQGFTDDEWRRAEEIAPGTATCPTGAEPLEKGSTCEDLVSGKPCGKPATKRRLGIVGTPDGGFEKGDESNVCDAHFYKGAALKHVGLPPP